MERNLSEEVSIGYATRAAGRLPGLAMSFSDDESGAFSA
jgi:hypothetical protein